MRASILRNVCLHVVVGVCENALGGILSFSIHQLPVVVSDQVRVYAYR